MRGLEGVALIVGGVATVDIAVFLGFCFWAVWYTFARRPEGAPWALWRRLATSWYRAHHVNRATHRRYADYIRQGRFPGQYGEE